MNYYFLNFFWVDTLFEKIWTSWRVENSFVVLKNSDKSITFSGDLKNSIPR
jgi:hypothetical protein